MTDKPTPIDRTSIDNVKRYQEQMEDILRWAGLGTWSLSVETKIFEVEAGLVERYGYSASKIARVPLERWLRLVHPDDQARVRSGFEDIFSNRTDHYETEFRLRARRGQWIWFQARGGVSERNTHGAPKRLSGTIQDVTKLKLAEEAIRQRDRLLAAANEAAKILLDISDKNFDAEIWKTLDLLGKASDVDRVYIWKNRTGEDGRRYTTQVYEWSLGAEPQQGNDLTVDIAFEEAIPTWEATLTSGNCVNNLVRLMPQAEQDQLSPQGIISILVAPIMFQGEFWGFIGFDDCTKERIWSDSEAGILKSAGLLIATTITRRMTEKALETEQALMKRVFETSPIGVVITTDGIIQRGNRQFFDLFQMKIGDTVFSVYDDSVARDEILAEIHEKGTVFNRNVQFHRRDGADHDFLVTYQQIDYEGKPSLLCWTVDITDLKKTEKELVLARDLAQVGTQAKSEFLARMSHEIRTPMNAILGMTYLCLQTELSEKQRDYLLKTQTATTNLLGIIDDILDFSKIEAGKLELEEVAFSLTEVLRDVIDMVEFKADDKALDLHTEVDGSVHDHWMGDPLRLRQILLNLTNNAVKFTDHGTIAIEVTAGKTDEKTGKNILNFSVRDTGIGMTASQIDNLFKSFSQADGSTTRKYGGTGLGLAISKNLVELMGGRIWVESETGQGTVFHFSVALSPVTRPLVKGQKSDLENRHILIVDDDPSAREVIRDLVHSFTKRVETAESGESALAALMQATRLSNPFDLVLLDWKMPRMDGIETVRRIRASKEIKEPPQILMISAYDRTECLRQSRGLGLAGFLVKPATRRSLQEALLTALEQKASEATEQLPEPENDIRGARVLLVEDNKINQMVASELIRMLGVEVMIANNGVEAVDAVTKNDYDLILMDIQMPVMDGLTAAGEIRKLLKPGIDKLPILAMTANATDIDYQKSLDVGMNDHLTKPIDPVKLRRALETWIVRS